MFGLKKCKEEDFGEFTYSNGTHNPENISGKLMAIMIGIFVFLSIEYFYLSVLKTDYKPMINVMLVAFMIISVAILCISKIREYKYAYKFQKSMLVIFGVYWTIMAFVMYLAPLILGIAEHHDLVVRLVYYLVIIGIVYFIVIFTRLIYLIRKGEMKKDCIGLYERLINRKIALASGGLSIPVIVFSGRFARHATRAMDSAGDRVGPLILMLVFGFIINIVFLTYLTEIIILAYCKFRFESFIISGDPKVREREYRLERKRIRRANNNKQQTEKNKKTERKKK